MVRRAESFSVKTVGASHIAKNLQCQDSAFSKTTDSYSFAVISDGHGGSDYFRSDRGSSFAVKAFSECIDAAFASSDEMPLDDNLISILANSSKREETEVFQQLIKSIVYKWHVLVEDDIRLNPFQLQEMVNVSDEAKEKYLEGKYVERAYGATLIGAVVIPGSFWFGIHIGDGKCVAFDLNGEPSEPIPWDDRCFLNITSSICDNDAVSFARYYFSRDIPPAVFVASDGVDDCFKRDKDFYDFYREIILSFATASSKEEAISELEGFLPAMSKAGSKDDISISGILDVDYLAENMNLFKKKKENYLKIMRVGNLGSKDDRDYLQRGVVVPVQVGIYSFDHIGCGGFGFGRRDFNVVKSDIEGVEIKVDDERFFLSEESSLYMMTDKNSDSFDLIIFSLSQK